VLAFNSLFRKLLPFVKLIGILSVVKNGSRRQRRREASEWMLKQEKPMRKLVMSLSVLGGLLFVGTIPASANVASANVATTARTGANVSTDGLVTKTGWRHGGWHRGWHRGWRGGGIYLGLPFVGYGYYPRYRYYDDYYYPYYGGRYYYGHRHWRGHRGYWGGHRGHWGGHRGHWRGGHFRGHRGHGRHR
jgi:hypothetical protein